jgi:hypothetical protein
MIINGFEFVLYSIQMISVLRIKMESITLKKALQEIKSCRRSNEQRCSIDFVTFDRRRSAKEGSSVKQVTDVFLAKGSARYDAMSNNLIHVASRHHTTPWPIHLHLIMKVNGMKVYG